MTSPDPFLGQPTAKLMLLGTFHFQDAGLDWYKPQSSFDVFSEKRQAEIARVVGRLAAYRPTRIAVERDPEQQAELDQSYNAYLHNQFQLSAGEVYQLGFRLAAHLGHERIYAVNDWGRHYEEPPLDIEAYAQQHNQGHLLSEWSPRFKTLYEHQDKLRAQRSLREILLQANSAVNIIRGHGHYMVDWFKVGGPDNEYLGADWITAWYNRNLRIFANLQRITNRKDERLLLIIGGGHIPILRHCAQASPEYELVEVHDYLSL